MMERPPCFYSSRWRLHRYYFTPVIFQQTVVTSCLAVFRGIVRLAALLGDKPKSIIEVTYQNKKRLLADPRKLKKIGEWSIS